MFSCYECVHRERNFESGMDPVAQQNFQLFGEILVLNSVTQGSMERGAPGYPSLGSRTIKGQISMYSKVYLA